MSYIDANRLVVQLRVLVNRSEMKSCLPEKQACGKVINGELGFSYRSSIEARGKPIDAYKEVMDIPL